MTSCLTRPLDLVVEPPLATLNLQARPADEECVIDRSRPVHPHLGGIGA